MTKPKAKKPAPKPRGRPSKWTDAIGAEICERLGKGEPLTVICRDEHMPADSTVRVWAEKDAHFSSDIAQARARGYDAIAEQCLAIADETAYDTLYTENGPKADAEWISRSKLRVETRLKLLAKWDPKRYGDKLELEHKGAVDLVSILNEARARS